MSSAQTMQDLFQQSHPAGLIPLPDFEKIMQSQGVSENAVTLALAQPGVLRNGLVLYNVVISWLWPEEEQNREYLQALAFRQLVSNEVRRRMEFLSMCKATEIGWIRSSYLANLKGIPLLRRQELEHEANAMVIGSPTPGAQLWIISHPWLGKQHADVTGVHVLELARLLSDLGAKDCDLVFYDYGSMYQWSVAGCDDRSEGQKKMFKKQLKSINRLYSSEFGKVVFLSTIPEQPIVRLAGYERNDIPYDERGWCFFEAMISYLFRTCANGGDRIILRSVLRTLFTKASFSVENDRENVINSALDAITMTEQEASKMDAAIEACLRDGTFTLVRVGFLRQLVREGAITPRRQDAPAEAFGDFRISSNRRFIASYAWTTVSHPDPKGVILRLLVSKLDFLNASDEDLVFLDFLSLFQVPRTCVEEEAFHKALKVAPLLPSGVRFKMIVCYGGTPERPYSLRGYCLNDILLSAFAGNLIFDDPTIMDIFIKQIFRQNLKSKKFTNGTADFDLVAKLFADLVYERAGLAPPEGSGTD